MELQESKQSTPIPGFSGTKGSSPLPSLSQCATNIARMNTPLITHVLRHMGIRPNFGSLQQHEHGYTLRLRTVPDYNFIYVIRGRVVWVIDECPHPLGCGDLVLVPPHVKHHAHSLTQRVTLGSVHVDVFLPGRQDVLSLLQPPRQQHVPRGSRLDGFFRGVMAEFARGDDDASHRMFPGWAHLIVHEYIAHNAREGLIHPRAVNPVVVSLLHELDRRMAETVTLPQLAATSGFSAQHLNLIFRRALGMTPLQYHLRARIDRAAALLREGRLTVHAIARQVGFDDAYYFSRMFRKQHGQSPAQYRAAMDSDSPSRSTAVKVRR